MQLDIYQVDAFASEIFRGNPAAVCPLDSWLSDELMQKIAAENNLSETAFYVPKGDEFELRWFTPTVEANLCGHATLATALVERLRGNARSTLNFHTKSGVLTTTISEDGISMNFPVDELQEIPMKDHYRHLFSKEPKQAIKGKEDLILVFETENEIIKLQPDLQAIASIPVRGVIVTASGNDVDFVSRFFGPQSGIDEDPVTGSAHTSLTSFWSKKLGKEKLEAIQLSQRKGVLKCILKGDRVLISGQAKLYMKGTIFLEPNI